MTYEQAKRDFEIHMMRIKQTDTPNCIGKLRKVVNGDGNFDIYHNGDYLVSIAKPNSGCRDSVFGNMRHVKRLIHDGYMNPSLLTKYGRRLLRTV